MKNFVKMTLATIAGLFIFGFVALFIMIAMFGAIAAMGDTQPVIPSEGVLQIDMSTMALAEQTQESDPFASLSGSQTMTPIGIYSAIKAVNAAATDPAVKFIYMKPDAATGGLAQLEEFRTALENFRNSGKAIVSYIENPTNIGYYLASVSDKIYMTVHDGGLNMFNGISSQMIFLKDILDRMGINAQLIRHGKYKSAGEMFVRNSSSKENLEQNESMVKSVWGSWAEKIAASRGITVEDLDAVLNNLELIFPSDFMAKGLVDELLTREQLQQQLCDLYSAEKYEDIKAIKFPDYVKAKSSAINLKAKNKVAVIYAEGNIVDGNEKQQIAGDRFAQIISDVRKDTTVKAVVFRVNSTGGSVLASEKIKAEIGLIQENGIPVIASYGDAAASGGYWISAGCDHIFANATSLTGSIGVFSLIPDISKTLSDKIHINITPVNSNRHADMYNMMRPLDHAETAYMQATVERIYEKFIEIVAEGREMSIEAVDAVGQGRVWTGAEALEHGLVDEIGTIEDAIIYAAMSIDGVNDLKDVQIAEYPKPLSTFEVLMESLGGSGSSVFAGTPLESVEHAFTNWNTSESGKVYARLPFEISIR
ncbi:MAG: signal peptide peptidase SppA [Bacteroidales bacterium]|nr:signal peptide peptidase SppA [Bacteroidales bacterium]